MLAKVRDLSHWNTVTDPAAVAGVTDAVVHKATQGLSMVDDQYLLRVAQFAGLVAWGAYHFFEDGKDGAAQADWFVDHVGEKLAVYVCDVETVLLTALAEYMGVDPSYVRGLAQLPTGAREVLSGQVTIQQPGSTARAQPFQPFTVASPLTLTDRVLAFAARVKARTGEDCMLYTSPGFANSQLQPWRLAGVMDLYVAHWTTAAAPALPGSFTAWTVWQYTNAETCPGIAKPADAGRFNGDVEDCRAYFGIEPDLPPVDPPSEVKSMVSIDPVFSLVKDDQQSGTQDIHIVAPKTEARLQIVELTPQEGEWFLRLEVKTPIGRVYTLLDGVFPRALVKSARWTGGLVLPEGCVVRCYWESLAEESRLDARVNLVVRDV